MQPALANAEATSTMVGQAPIARRRMGSVLRVPAQATQGRPSSVQRRMSAPQVFQRTYAATPMCVALLISGALAVLSVLLAVAALSLASASAQKLDIYQTS